MEQSSVNEDSLFRVQMGTFWSQCGVNVACFDVAGQNEGGAKMISINNIIVIVDFSCFPNINTYYKWCYYRIHWKLGKI